MATILLQAAGTFLGGLFGPFGALLGRAAGGLAGYALDRALIDGTRSIEGPRLSSARPFTAEEGAPIPRLYGTARLGGTLIWATRFEEVKTKKRQGFKGGPRTTEYSYFANVAFALCEGEIAAVRRVWADGREVDRTTIELRVHSGSQTQPADPLIAAKQGAGNAPAYRGLAYVVIERLPIGDYGNRIPQFQFEVVRPLGKLRWRTRAVALIPGATEYGLSPALVTRSPREGETIAENRHVLFAGSDFVASLDELQALCPLLEHVALVVAWFGDDLRAGECRIRPGVTALEKPGLSHAWSVGGVARADAHLVSTHEGGAAYGGTPSDASVVAAIAELRNRGLKVTLYPFVMMDVPAGNALPDPYGGVAQAAYPWRGRITCDPAPGRPGTADKTAAARTQVADFLGHAEVGDFAVAGGAVDYSGAADDWGYRRFLLHMAHLAKAAGGVDAFLIGSELRGLSTLRDGAGDWPFVEALCALADEAHGVLGDDTAVTYAADWSEYFGHQPADGTGDVFFHLDPLWARPSVAAVGIDNYMPLSDWRDADAGGASPDGAYGPYDRAALTAAIAGGEGFDWYYASEEDRAARLRTEITDGAHSKPWVFRYKDLVSWWSNPHVNRPGGTEAGAPTAWVPMSKPIWFTELGCPAVDKGPNQPNLFPDPKSAENGVPHFSDGGRSDLAMSRFLEAHGDWWDPGVPDFEAGRNPISPVYGGRMVDHERSYLWAWDARAFPAFPQRGDIWGDSANWARGHWLNGRLGNPDLESLLNAILADHGEPQADASRADGGVVGYVIDEPGSARAALEPLVELFDLTVGGTADGLVFESATAAREVAFDPGGIVLPDDGVAVEAVREPDGDAPGQAVLMFRDAFADYQAVAARAAVPGGGDRQEIFAFPGVLERWQANGLAGAWLRRASGGRERVTLSVAGHAPGIGPGALIRPRGPADRLYRVTQVEDGAVRRISARRHVATLPRPSGGQPEPGPVPPLVHVGRPRALLLDLPARSAEGAPQDQLRVAAWQKPWRRLAVLASPDTSGFILRATLDEPAAMGRLTEALTGSFSGRVDRRRALTVRLDEAEAASVSRLQLLNGANALAVRAQNGVWEILQFEAADEISPDIWRLTGLLRGQLGTEDAMLAGAAVGADVVLLGDAVAPAGLAASEIGLPMRWRIGAAGAEVTPVSHAEIEATGGMRARLPLAPVHLRCRRRADGGLDFSWVRRGRLDADDWAAIDIPLGEENEAYRIEIAAPGGPALRTADVATLGWTYPAGQIATDFGTMPALVDLTVRQRGLAGLGLPATRRLST